MFVRLLFLISISVLLFACSSDTTKKEQDVEVKDLSLDSSTDTNTATTDNDDATTYGTNSPVTHVFDELDNPQSQLSTRVIYFDYDSSEILPQYREVVEAHGLYLVNNLDKTITLEGHADERGAREYNLALGERRAQSIKWQMILLGARSAQIRLVSYGEERPAIEGHDESAWQQNRRVNIIY